MKLKSGEAPAHRLQLNSDKKSFLGGSVQVDMKSVKNCILKVVSRERETNM